MKEKDIKSTMQIHSQAKVEFYHKYLELYLVILYNTKYIQVINIYDVFCGMGLYTDGHKGSPIVAYDTIKKIFESNGKIKKVHLFINDIDESRVYKVKEYIDKNNMQMQCCEVSCFHVYNRERMFSMASGYKKWCDESRPYREFHNKNVEKSIKDLSLQKDMESSCRLQSELRTAF